ncbi:hypothetical protein GS436_09215 [Rhodococcus hoagii]|nr:hypothetical protein [Prescottella equi]NKS85942.1 hypothetical protein [Prescottella equi]
MRRFFSPRVTIALGIAGVTVLSVSALDTAAAFTDTANAASSFSSAAKLWPPPAAAAIGCDDVTISGAHLGVRLYVIHDGSKKKYRLRFKQDDGALRNTQDIDPGTAAAGTRFNFGAVGDAQVGSHTGWNYNAEIHTVDPAGGESTDWRGYRINQPTIWNLDCKDQISSISGASSEGMFAARAAEPTSTTVTPAPTTTTSSASSTPTATTGPSTTTTTTTGASTTATATATASTPKATTTTGPSTTTTTTTSTPSSTTTTTATPKLVNASASPDGTYVAGKSGSNAVVRDSAGEELFSRPVSGDAVMQWDSTDETLWIVDDGKIYRVTAGVWSAVSVDRETATVPAEIAALIK